MPKTDLRKYLLEVFGDRKDICITPTDFSHRRFEATIIDGLTRMHHPFPSKNNWDPHTGTTSRADEGAFNDGATLMNLFLGSIEYFFSKGSQTVVFAVDKSRNVPITKGVEQVGRVTKKDKNMENLIHHDERVRTEAYANLLDEIAQNPATTPKEAKDNEELRDKIDKQRNIFKDIQATKRRLTILELDDLRACWKRMPLEKKKEALRDARELGILVRWTNRENGERVCVDMAEGNTEDDYVRGSRMDDYYLETVLLTAVRNQPVPEPWDIFIKSNSHVLGSRAAIMGYIIRAMMHDYLYAFAPPPGYRVYIDGHDFPEWKVARRDRVTFRIDDDTKIETIDLTTRTKKTRARKPYINRSPLEFSFPVEETDQGQSSNVPSSQQDDVEYQLITNARRFFTHSGKAGVYCAKPDARQPRWRYAKEFGNDLGEADFILYRWVESLRIKSLDDIHTDNILRPTESPENRYRYFLLVSNDSDTLYLCLLYIHRLKKQGVPDDVMPQITMIMQRGWCPSKELIFDVNRLFDAIVDDLLGGIIDRLPELIYAFYAATGDYTLGYNHVPPHWFIRAICRHHDFIGPLYKWAVDADLNVKYARLEGAAYRRMLLVAYTLAYEKKVRLIAGQLAEKTIEEDDRVGADIIADECIDEMIRSFGRGLSQFRFFVNQEVISKPYRPFFGFDPETHRHVMQRLPPGHSEESLNELPANQRREAKKFFENFRKNISKRVPDDEEIVKRAMLLQYYMHMCSQIGESKMILADPIAMGYKPKDPSKPLSRRNIDFAAAHDYEIKQLQDRLEKKKEPRVIDLTGDPDAGETGMPIIIIDDS